MKRAIAPPIFKDRTGIDWSNHRLTIIKSKGLNSTVYKFKNPKTVVNGLYFINSFGVLTVTGDFGNWVFCREFHPSGEGKHGVSEMYWIEKLGISSTQSASNFDSDGTVKALEEQIEEFLYGIGKKEDDDLDEREEEIIEYYRECIKRTDDGEVHYLSFAHGEKLSWMDHEDVVYVERTKTWLKIVFDAFEMMCLRMKSGDCSYKSV